jgi:hypothetical protein
MGWNAIERKNLKTKGLDLNATVEFNRCLECSQPLELEHCVQWVALCQLIDHCFRPGSIAESAAEVALRRALGSCVELEGLFVSLDRIALCFPTR